MMLGEMLQVAEVTQEEIEKHLDALSYQERIRQVIDLNKLQQDRLWEIAGMVNKPLDTNFLVPIDAKPLVLYPFEGKNSLPIFTRFRKVFYKTTSGEIAGYNNQKMEKITGPGYFLVELSPKGPGPIVINYCRVPSEKPAGLPEIRPNERGLSRFIYCKTKDFLRYVSKDVVVGRAYKCKEDFIIPMPNYFVLCRQKR